MESQKKIKLKNDKAGRIASVLAASGVVASGVMAHPCEAAAEPVVKSLARTSDVATCVMDIDDAVLHTEALLGGVIRN